MRVRIVQCLGREDLFEIETKKWWQPFWQTRWIKGEYRFTEKDARWYAHRILNPVIYEVYE